MTRESFKDIETTNNFFRSIKERIGTNIGCCCICDWGVDYLKIRPNILECGREHGFSRIEFMDIYCSRYIYALSTNSYFPKFNDIIWIELGESECKNSTHYGIFQKMHESAQLVKTIRLNLHDRKALATLRTPTVVVNLKRDHPDDVLLIAKLFPFCKHYTYDIRESIAGFLLKAKIMSGEEELAPLNTQNGLLYTLHFFVDDLKIFTIPENVCFPFNKTILVSNILSKGENFNKKWKESLAVQTQMAKHLAGIPSKVIKHNLKASFYYYYHILIPSDSQVRVETSPNSPGPARLGSENLGPSEGPKFTVLLWSPL